MFSYKAKWQISFLKHWSKFISKTFLMPATIHLGVVNEIWDLQVSTIRLLLTTTRFSRNWTRDTRQSITYWLSVSYNWKKNENKTVAVPCQQPTQIFLPDQVTWLSTATFVIKAKQSLCNAIKCGLHQLLLGYCKLSMTDVNILRDMLLK